MKAGPYEVQVRVRANCRRMILRYRKQENELLLSVPPRATEKEIRAFLEGNMDWIRCTAGEAVSWKPQYAAGERHMCMGRRVTLGVDAPAGEAAYKQWRNQQLIPVLERLLQKWVSRLHVRVTHVSLREMSSRWGSCTASKGRLSFNSRLGLFDEKIIEETVVHELCHFFHQNHSAAFYAEMTKHLPDWQARKTQRESMDVRPLPPLR